MTIGLKPTTNQTANQLVQYLLRHNPLKNLLCVKIKEKVEQIYISCTETFIDL